MIRIMALTGLSACVVLAADPPTPAIDDKAALHVSMTFLKMLQHGQFDAAISAFDERVVKQIAADRLKLSWEQPSAQYGEFRSFGQPAVRRDVGGAYKFVLVPCQYARGATRVEIAVNPAGKISRMAWVPIEDKPTSMPAQPPPSTLIERDVVVGSPPWALPASLSLPKSGRPRAGVVLVHGPGPHDRNETVGLNTPFRDIAWGLAERGVAVLRYEKRTHAYQREMAARPLTIRDEVLDDANAAIRTLRGQPEMAGVPVFLLGHGMGGTLAPEIAMRDGNLAGVILLAAVARPYEDDVMEEARYLATFHKEPDTDERLAELSQQLDLLRQHKMHAGERVLGADASYWYDYGDHDGTAALSAVAKLSCPVLVIQGGRDYQATAVDFGLWKKALAGNSAATFRTFDNLNHLFQPGRGKATPMEYTNDKVIHVDPRVIDSVAGWCLVGGHEHAKK